MTVKEYSPQLRLNNLQQYIPVSYCSPESTKPYAWNGRENEKRGTIGDSLNQHISHFDRNWKTEGLQPDWYRLRSSSGRQIGFSMNTQMELLRDETSPEAVAAWTSKTVQDLMGFKLEYLTDHVIYPCKYERSKTDSSRLENTLYGNTDIIETASNKERNGSVRRSLQEIKEFFLTDDTPNGSIAVMVSPRGETGLKTDEGNAIRYPDSYFYIFVKDGDTIHNFTLKTDFNLPECREAISRLTGVILPIDASLEDYVQTVAKIKPGYHGAVPDVNDIVGVLELVRPEYAFKPQNSGDKVLWSDVYQEILMRDKLYAFNEKTLNIINDFEAYCLEANHTKEEYQKALAATILRMSKVFFVEEQKSVSIVQMYPNRWAMIKPQITTLSTYGDVLNATVQRPGCAGGGESENTSVNSITSRLGTSASGDEYGSLTFECPHCGFINERERGKLISVCGENTNPKQGCGESVKC